jgi:hypothetical protein
MARDDWTMSLLADQGAYRGAYPDEQWPAPPMGSTARLPDAGGAQLGAIGNTMQRLAPHLIDAFHRSFRAPSEISAENTEQPGSEEWQHLENVKADRGATFGADWALNTLGLGRLGGGVKGGVGVGGGKITQPQPKMGEFADQSGMNMLQDVLRETTNRGIIDKLLPPPRTHSERIAARTKGMSDTDVLNSDELWAMTRDLMAQREVPFTQAYSQLAERRLGRPLTPEEITTAMTEGARAGVATPSRYGDLNPLRTDPIVRTIAQSARQDQYRQ